ncbi:phage tail protein [Salmonella enterica]|uniref:Phage tail protein n=3 Tax=Salmonella enterica TaxID=28901 RepID=A0A5W3EAT8_SALAN|nr:phage tail protein [Salmonella enterica]EBD0465486.1 phage tail protein [Salmonella enterica subsp. enterica]EBW5997178.1 phage tail protein [Salmonella enterica subsp. enterica serovar Anatum]HCZ4781920.1 phage tail protein [Salmonella enterica subsp. enterica serovar Saintpaul str. CFSAN004131]EAM2052024.1 phage tail protein [Salmonella enterica]EAM8756956.1 phage tail protein [Salmonella enterica]
MDNEFYTLLTDRGMAKIASALADKKQLHLQKMAVGDGGGQYYEPTASQTKLRHEVWRGEMNTLTVAPNNPNWLIAELVLPEDIGGWYVREVGVFDDEGELIAIGKFPESYKPLLPGGCGKQVCIRLIMEVSNTTAVTLTVDPSIVLATRDYVDARLDEHEHSTNHPDATLTQKGFTQLSNATDSDDETKAATPKAVKAAMDKANAAAPASHTHAWNQITGVPDGTLTQKGIVKLNSATDSTSTTEAATPSAVKAAMDKASAAAPAGHTHAWGQITGTPDGTLTQKGIVKLNNATDSTSTTEAATPSAVKAAYDKASAAAPANHSHYQFFTVNGTFIVPDGVNRVFVEVVGGGGGGAGGSLANEECSTGGIAAKCVAGYVDVVPKSQIPVMIGAGGSGGAKGSRSQRKGFSGNAGGQSSFGNLNAPGGAGGAAGGTGGNTISFLPPSGNGGARMYEYVTLGLRGSNSVLGIGGVPGTVTLDHLEIVAGSLPSNASGFGAGGAGGSSSASNREYLGDWVLNKGSSGSPGIVRIYW